MRKGFILPVLFLLIALGIVYYIFVNYSRTPNNLTQKTANSIYKYPDSNWQIKESKNVCFIPLSTCLQPVFINFDASSWGEVYQYYVTYMKERGWKTNTEVVTSVPTSVTFDQPGTNCHVALEPKTQDQFQFSISCPEK